MFQHMWDEVSNLLQKKKETHLKIYSRESSKTWKILKNKDKSYLLLNTTRQNEMNCLRDNAVAADRKIPHDLFSCFLRTNQTCATIHSQRESHPIPSFVAQSVLEESQSQSKFEKDSNSLLSESHQYGEELTREYKIKRNDWTSVRRSLYKEFVQPVGQQLSVGTLLGLATGYSLRRIGRFALFLIGTEVLVLQLMAYKGWVTIHWNKLSRDIIPVLDKSAAESIMDILLYKMPFTAAFCAGLRLAP